MNLSVYKAKKIVFILLLRYWTAFLSLACDFNYNVYYHVMWISYIHSDVMHHSVF